MGSARVAVRRLVVLLGLLVACRGQTQNCRIEDGSYPCDCCCCSFKDNKTSVFCTGPNVTDVPENLPESTTHINFERTGIVNITASPTRNVLGVVVRRSKFHKYKSLVHLVFKNNLKLAHLNIGAFDFHAKNNLPYLRIQGSPNLKHIPAGVFGAFSALETLIIKETGLTAPPGWAFFDNGEPLTLIDLSDNEITELNNQSFSEMRDELEIAKLNLQGNKIKKITGTPFFNVTIKEIFLNRNDHLVQISDHAFVHNKKKGPTKLDTLDLSDSKISYLPTQGLEKLTDLVLRNTWYLKIFPSVLGLLSMKQATLTYSQHCCAFKYPKVQDPKRWEDFEKTVQENCSTTSTSSSTAPVRHTKSMTGGYPPTTTIPRRRLPPTAPRDSSSSAKPTGSPRDTATPHHILIPAGNGGDSWGAPILDPNGDDLQGDGFSQWGAPIPIPPDVSNDTTFLSRKKRHKFTRFVIPKDRSRFHTSNNSPTLASVERTPLFGRTKRDTDKYGMDVAYMGGEEPKDDTREFDNQKWLNRSLDLDPNDTIIEHCGINGSGEVMKSLGDIKCTPEVDQLNPCEDLMGYSWLRVIVWFVVVTAFLGNLVVLTVTMCSRHKLTVAKFLMCNLAFADLTLGAYLLMLAAFDLHSMKEYFIYAIPWQYEGGCQAAGFLAVFSTCLSVFTLTVITMERWYAISHAIHLNKRLRLKQASGIMVGCWCFALILAMLPLLGVSSYSVTAICLPMDVSTNIGLIYVSSLLLVNAVAFFIICWCYFHMYMKVTGNETSAGRNDVTIAKRMAILVFTDFVCLFPIAFFGLTAAFGLDIITVTDSKILLVFFFPLNSCCNPFLYAIFTKQFKKDFFEMLSRFGMCEKRAAKYRMTYLYTSNPMSLSHSRSSLQHQLGHRVNRNAESGGTQSYLSDRRGSRPWSDAHKIHYQSPPSSPNNLPNDSIFHSCSNNNMSTAIPNEVVTTAAIERARRLSIVPESSSVCDDGPSRSDDGGSRGQQGRRHSDAPVRKTVRSVSQYNTNTLLKKSGASNGVQANKRKESQSTMVTMLSTTTTETTCTDTSTLSAESEEAGEGTSRGEERECDNKVLGKQGSTESYSDSQGNVYHSVPCEEESDVNCDKEEESQSTKM